MALMKIIRVTGFVSMSSACSLDDIKRLSHEAGNHYVCNYQEPNLPDKVRECQKIP
ncbi:MAG: hypothetical protein ACI909_003269 [Planctomycetota bacterium]|jgi:hypothetical protein